MESDNQQRMEKFQNLEKVYILYNQQMNIPFVECDEQTLDDQVYVFASKEAAVTWAAPFAKEKYQLVVREFPGKLFQAWLVTIAALGINALMLQEEGAPVRLQLSDLIQMPDFRKAKEAKIPEANPELQLTMIYLLQEIRRPVERTEDEKKELVRLEEEMAHNLLHSRIIVSFDTPGVKGKWNPTKPGQEAKVPVIKTQDGSVFQPVYTEIGEFRKFNLRNKNRTMQLAAVPFEKLSTFLLKNTKGMILNPGGFNYILTRELMDNLMKRYGDLE